ncbi:MAG TPA: glycosyltransferase family 39 protein [Pyrinomonadaceae bacterium]|nr:glycosyltransferase family 39 protein [Pyrinomonadaceae bacterium]
MSRPSNPTAIRPASFHTSHADEPPSFWRAWLWWLVPALIGLALVLWFVDPFIGDWDGLDYTMLSLAGYPSSMALGRNLFIFGNYALYETVHRLFGVQPESAYLVFKYAVVAQSPLALIAGWVLARDFTRSVYSATLAALFIALSPVFVLYGGQVMTDVPSVLLLSVALIIHYRGLQQERIWMVMLGAALLGLGMNLRETIGFYGPWLVIAPFVCGWKLGRRQIVLVALSCFLFFVCAFSWFGFWFITDSHYRWIWFGWRESMRQETARHPITLRNLWPYLAYFFISAPLVLLSLPLAMRSEWRLRRLSPTLLLAGTGLFANLLLFLNYSTAINWRYFLTGLPAMAPLCADFLIRTLNWRVKNIRIAFGVWATLVLGFAIVFGLVVRPASRQFIERRAMSKEYGQRLKTLPRDAVMLSGSQTIAVTYWKAIGAGNWKTIGTGGGWPGDNLVPLIEEHLNGGRRVFLDADPRWWLPCGWQRDEIVPIVNLQKRFRFRRATETIYELRPVDDASATDSPHLESLLPENRPEDMKKCPHLQG